VADPLLVKLDENLGLAHLALVRQFGYAADRATDEGLSGAEDEEIWKVVRKEGRLLITLDTDFSDIRKFNPIGGMGTLVLRPVAGDKNAVLRVLLRVLNEQPLETYSGLIAIADEARTRTRRPS
jgi:predicted nuclease of predicted toxin-antitoxin system